MVILPISSLLAMLRYDICFLKLPLAQKYSFKDLRLHREHSVMSKIAIFCVYLLIKESPHADSCAEGSFTKQISYLSVAKSDEIGHKKRLFSG